MLRMFFALAAVSLAQSPDSSGNAMLKGTFQFRQVALMNFDASGNPVETATAFGTIKFDGAGRYSLTGTCVDNTISAGAPHPLGVYGTYTIASNGFGKMTNPLASSDPAGFIYGGAAQGIFIGSATESTSNNLFVAIPAADAPPLDSAYSMGLLDFGPSMRNALFALTTHGNGSIDDITVGAQRITGTVFTTAPDGSLTINFPSSPNAPLSGAKTMFISADGRFALGWTPNGYDILFGVKGGAASDDKIQGIYFIAGLENGPNDSSCGAPDAYYGSLVADGNGNQIVHRRLASPLCYVIDYETDAQMRAGSAASAFTADGRAFVAVGAGGTSSLSIGVRANDFTGPGVFLNPAGVMNSASGAPATMGIASGELITLYGSGLAPAARVMQGGDVFPPVLEDVQVLVNGTPAPIYYISPSQLSVMVPDRVRSSTTGIASLQVINGGTKSNTVSVFVTNYAPGIFTQSANGLGYAAAVHANSGELVTAANPARAGENIAIFMTGLGTVNPAVQDGAPGHADPLSVADVYAANQLSVYFNDYARQAFPKAKVGYAGLAPGLAGLYQINVQVPQGVGPGDVYIEIVAGSADVNQAKVPIGG